MAAALESEEFAHFVTYATIIMIKMILMSSVTAYFRITKSVYANEEDTASFSPNKKVIMNDPDVERVRRCHRNDLENIIPFFALGLLYALTSGASVCTIVWHYRVFVVSRILHTIVYLGAVPQPSRVLCFAVGMVVNVSMAVQILMNNFNL